MKKKRELSIREEQDIYFRILCFFDRVCEAENLKYSLAYGTLLGAVREQGFIDWDDDIDVWMPRKDYNRFNQVFSNYAPEQYFLQNYETDPRCVSPEMARICVHDTYKWPEGCERETFHTGMFFDIFPLDNGFGTGQDQIDLEYSLKLHQSIRRTLRIRRKKTLKSKIYEFSTGFLPREKYIQKYVKMIQTHADCESDVYLVFATSYAGTSRSYFRKEFFDRLIRIPFESFSFPAPEKADDLLRYMYGEDYLTPIRTKQERTIAYLVKP